MTKKQKKVAIKSRVNHMLDELILRIKNELIYKALESGVLDIDEWDEHVDSMVLPKAILKAILESEANQYSMRFTSYQKSFNKEVKNLKLFI